jgi:hypothetical protein
MDGEALSTLRLEIHLTHKSPPQGVEGRTNVKSIEPNFQENK